MPTHIVIPDTQAKEGAPTQHLRWIGRYIADKFYGRNDVRIIHVGDHADMPSLSSYDKGKKEMEGRRYRADIDAANEAFDILCEPMERSALQRKKWRPDRHILLGNHEDRITRAQSDNAQLDGALSLDHLNYADHGWQVHDFLEPVELDGVRYAHYFYAPNTGRPYTGMVETRLKNIGVTFTMGHQQGFMYGVRYVAGRPHNGLIVGSAYLHDEEYRGPQANEHWRGIVVCHEVNDGDYNLMQVSLDYLCRRYEGKPLRRQEWIDGA